MFCFVLFFFQALPEPGPGQRQRHTPQQPGQVSGPGLKEAGAGLPRLAFNISISPSNHSLQIRLQGRVRKVQALHDDNPDVWSDYLPLFPQLPVRKRFPSSELPALDVFFFFVSHLTFCHSILLLFLFRVTDEIFNFLLVWYYCTLTIRESILMSNGSRCALRSPPSLLTVQLFETIALIIFFYAVTSYCFTPFQFALPSDLPRIKGWWVSHHYVSTFLSGVMLTW